MIDITAQLKKGGLVELDRGEYVISEPITLRPGVGTLVLRGKGLGLTAIVPADATFDRPLLTLQGTTKDGKQQYFPHFEIRDLSFQAADRELDCLLLDTAVLGRLDRVGFHSFHGTAIRGVQWWDSVAHDCHVVRCGHAELDKPAVVLADMRPWQRADGTPASPRDSNCNNLSFVSCRLDRSRYVAMQLGSYATRNRLVSCKFHGELPTPYDADHLQLVGAFGNNIVGCNLVNGGRNAVLLSQAWGNVLLGNQLSNNRVGVKLDRATNNSIIGNCFATPKDRPNGQNIIGPATANALSGNVGL